MTEKNREYKVPGKLLLELGDLLLEKLHEEVKNDEVDEDFLNFGKEHGYTFNAYHPQGGKDPIQQKVYSKLVKRGNLMDKITDCYRNAQAHEKLGKAYEFFAGINTIVSNGHSLFVGANEEEYLPLAKEGYAKAKEIGE